MVYNQSFLLTRCIFEFEIFVFQSVAFWKEKFEEAFKKIIRSPSIVFQKKHGINFEEKSFEPRKDFS